MAKNKNIQSLKEKMNWLIILIAFLGFVHYLGINVEGLGSLNSEV